MEEKLLELIKLQDKVIDTINEKVKLDHTAIKLLMDRTDSIMETVKGLLELIKLQDEQLTLLQDKISAMEKKAE